jgi:hypothetical protein
MGSWTKSGRNREALHDDFHISEATVFANYTFAFASRLRFLLARKGVKDLAAYCREASA